MSKSPSKFLAYDNAVAAQAELTSFRGKIRSLETEKAMLAVDVALPPLEAASQFVSKGAEIDNALRQHRLALDLVSPAIEGLWEAALVELRPVIGELEEKARVVADDVTQAAVRLFTPITDRPDAAASHNASVIASNALVHELSQALSNASNSSMEEHASGRPSRPVAVSDLHEAITAAPDRLKAIEADLAKLEAAATEIERRFPATVEVAA